jgi:hypothetical protein
VFRRAANVSVRVARTHSRLACTQQRQIRLLGQNVRQRNLIQGIDVSLAALRAHMIASADRFW